MKPHIAWLAAASLASSSPHSFSVTDDLLAYPQNSLTSSQPPTELAQRHPLSNNDPDVERSSDFPASPSSYERMILDSTTYLCSVPAPSPDLPQNATATHLAAEEEKAELARATDRGWDLLQEMSGSCLYFISGWWSYQFCYSESVKQFHQLPAGGNVPMFPPVEDPTTPSYVLGKFGEKKVNRHRLPSGGSAGGALDGGLPLEDGQEGSTTTIQAKGSSSSRYLSQKLSGGTTCDLTGAPRRVEIQFHCHPQSADRIGWIKEVSTCSYLMVVYTPRLCNDVAFLPEREERAEQVVCSEVVREGEEVEWKRKKSREAERKLVGQIEGKAGAKATKMMVGDIEVGAMKHVGGDKGWLKTSEQTAGSHGHGMNFAKDGPKGQNIAHQHKVEDGGAVHKLSDKEMKALGVDVKTANAAIKELQDVAMGKGWRLEIFNQNGKVEMRGVIDEQEGLATDQDEGEDGFLIVANEEEDDGNDQEYRDEL
ncbi:uncharacterized protein KY384_004232 [Bacidia gigantensis]|uniref:uncharacterized protein n=1 Tax=Bacidia gigantensis TaxID=2732470 RepID=UPI001D04B4E8|nr:uncharacterized protein KY384_004232 [Bacidia gigantensis]KAG8530875.1 hypothetical protein KY384_004232 [Bacidia gigantensis]